MPLAKKTKGSKQNQGAQWGDTGSAGNIKHKSSEEVAGGPESGPRNNKHAYLKTIGKGRSVKRRSTNPE